MHSMQSTTASCSQFIITYMNPRPWTTGGNMALCCRAPGPLRKSLKAYMLTYLAQPSNPLPLQVTVTVINYQLSLQLSVTGRLWIIYGLWPSPSRASPSRKVRCIFYCILYNKYKVLTTYMYNVTNHAHTHTVSSYRPMPTSGGGASENAGRVLPSLGAAFMLASANFSCGDSCVFSHAIVLVWPFNGVPVANNGAPSAPLTGPSAGRPSCSGSGLKRTPIVASLIEYCEALSAMTTFARFRLLRRTTIHSTQASTHTPAATIPRCARSCHMRESRAFCTAMARF